MRALYLSYDSISIEQMSIAADEATSGQVVISAHSHELLLGDGDFAKTLKFVSELTEGEQYLLKEIVPLEKGRPIVQLTGRHLLNDLQARSAVRPRRMTWHG